MTWRALIVPGIPFALSLALSLSTVGTSVGWQDSGFFLCAVKEMGLLHPPGFVLYLLLCKAWTFLFFFLDFTLAVHLFSSFCAAGAAGSLAVAGRDLLRSRGPIFQVTAEDPGARADGAGIAVGCLAASGYTFWASGIAAKGYALYYLVVALLLWRMIRADETRAKRDFTIVAALIGLAWAAHPSAADAGLALALFVGFHARALGWKGVAARTGLAAACALGPSLLLPLLSTRFNDLSRGLFRYLRGGRYTDVPDVFGFAPTRWESLGRLTWEELLGVGTLVALAGLVRLAIVNRRLLLGIAAWILPIAIVAALFKIEGQLDFWLVPAWMALLLAGAAALVRLPRAARAGVAVAGVAWAAAANVRDLNERGNELPAAFGKVHLANLDRDATLVVASDDALAIASYLQVVKGERPDVKIVNGSRLPAAGTVWSHGTFFENPPASVPLVAAGTLMKVVRAGETTIDPRYWSFPIEPETVAARMRRARGQRVEFTLAGIAVEPEAYERRLLFALVRARRHLAVWYLSMKTPEGYRQGAELLESILKVDTGSGGRLEVVYPLATACVALGRNDRAEVMLRQTLALAPPARVEAGAAYHLSRILEARGLRGEAESYRLRAVMRVNADPSLRAEFESFTKPR